MISDDPAADFQNAATAPAVDKEQGHLRTAN